MAGPAELYVPLLGFIHYQARLGSPFAHEGYRDELRLLRDQLQAGLAGATPEQGAAPLPPVAEVAARIKELIGSNRIDDTAERPGPRSTPTAERPVTARIRERRAARQVSLPEKAEDVTTEAVSGPAAPDQADPPTPVPAEVRTPPPPPAVGFRDRIRQRQARPRQMSLFS